MLSRRSVAVLLSASLFLTAGCLEGLAVSGGIGTGLNDEPVLEDAMWGNLRIRGYRGTKSVELIIRGTETDGHVPSVVDWDFRHYGAGPLFSWSQSDAGAGWWVGGGFVLGESRLWATETNGDEDTAEVFRASPVLAAGWRSEPARAWFVETSLTIDLAWESLDAVTPFGGNATSLTVSLDPSVVTVLSVSIGYCF